MGLLARTALLFALAALFVAGPALADSHDDDDSAFLDDDDDSAFYSATVPLEDRVLGGGCEDGQSCSVSAGVGSGLPLLLFGAAFVRRRR